MPIPLYLAILSLPHRYKGNIIGRGGLVLIDAVSPATESFPVDFAWGAATSALQIEGACRQDGRGESIWDSRHRDLCQHMRSSGDCVSPGHYHNVEADIQMMKRIGIKAYRFSTGWARIIPFGKGRINQLGMDFYDRLVDKLHEAGIEPFVTLNHWDLPQALQIDGGWANPETRRHFLEFVKVVSNRIGDRVNKWITHNEPWVIAFYGYLLGLHPPKKRNLRLSLMVAHNLILSHWECADVLKHNEGTEVGIALNLSPVFPATTSERDTMAARHFDLLLNRWFLDAVLRGEYPSDVPAVLRDALESLSLPNVGSIEDKTDFIGLNYYSRKVVRHAPQSRILGAAVVDQRQELCTDDGREVYPEGIYAILMRLHREYHARKIYVTENGACIDDKVGKDSAVHDHRRITYIRDHLAFVRKAMQDGANVRGYFVWSLIDGFEWTSEYNRRFGLVYVDYETGRRVLKESGAWYRGVISANSARAAKNVPHHDLLAMTHP